ncbi:hypothetical protein ASG31_03220 [Chryseobacterium sp. Leaf404]|uniref:hypothetical protein n=1 Tax=unclassified Chryseobacterium TaxID=2593645 RepID=UPI0007009673|nr:MULTISPECIES: hypothetical protein [unclassified Chryseobacterium]KQT22354.1 hypothetical protein ASG31_03220 [Chryseobacterium sp. Leaf404]
MNFKIKTSFLLLFVLNFFFAQTITFVSERSGQPLTKVSVFGKDGNILGFSDIDGKIDRSALKPEQEKFKIIHENLVLAELSYAEINKDIVKLNDKVREIEAVVIKKSKPAKYLFIRGNFNSYVVVNNKLNCYVDGVATYIFDNKTKKVKSTNIEQYRIFWLESAENEFRKMGSWDYSSSLELPKLKDVGNIYDYKSKKAKIKELKSAAKDQMEITGEALQNKEFSILGIRLFDIKTILNVSYEKDSKKTLRDFIESNEIGFMKLKHKTEENYNQVVVYRNFNAAEIDFSNSKDVPKVKYDKTKSNYATKYWEDPSFPNMQTVFSSFFKDDLKEKQNVK